MRPRRLRQGLRRAAADDRDEARAGARRRERPRTGSRMLVPVAERLERWTTTGSSGASGARTTPSGRTTRPRSPTGWGGSRSRHDGRAGRRARGVREAGGGGRVQPAVLLGMGGSSLAPEVFAQTFGSADGALELIVLDTTHPATIERVAGELELEKTLFIVASKSGGTTETLSHFAYFWTGRPTAPSSSRSPTRGRRSRRWRASTGSAPCS